MPFVVLVLGSHLRRDNVVSVLYAEGLHATQSSVFLQRPDRQGRMDQKSADVQRFWGQRQAEHTPSCPSYRVLQEQGAASQTAADAPREAPGVLRVGNGGQQRR